MSALLNELQLDLDQQQRWKALLLQGAEAVHAAGKPRHGTGRPRLGVRN